MVSETGESSQPLTALFLTADLTFSEFVSNLTCCCRSSSQSYITDSTVNRPASSGRFLHRRVVKIELRLQTKKVKIQSSLEQMKYTLFAV